MSINYHAAQCRGYLLSEYEAHQEHWRGFFKNYNPERAARILNLKTDEEYIYVTYYQVPFRLQLTDGVLEKYMDGEWSKHIYFNEAMACYHYLYYVTDHPLITGRWVPSLSLDAAASRSEYEPDPLFAPFEKRFTGRCDILKEYCTQLGGQTLDKGDFSCEFEAFPQIHLRLVFYDADEDFPAQVQILTDSRVTDFIHFETTGCLISDLFEKIERLDGAEPPVH